MDLNSIDLLGNSSIGIFGMATNSYSIIPYNTEDTAIDTIKTTLKVPIIKASLNNSSLNGLFAVGNEHHLLLPSLISNSEIEEIKQHLPNSDVEISVLDSTITALGNVIVCNNRLALISSEFNREERKLISDLLDVEIISRDLMNTTIVGSLLFLNNHGILAHPLTSDEDLDWIEDQFGIRVDVVTVNRGTPYPRPGLIGNDEGILVGSDTTGPELMRIYDVLANN